MDRRRDRTTRRVATSKNAGTMMRMSVGMVDVASGLMHGVAYHLMHGVAYLLMYGVANHPMSAGVNGRTRVVTEILVAGPTPAPGMVATTHCRMANAGLTFGAEPTRPIPSGENTF